MKTSSAGTTTCLLELAPILSLACIGECCAGLRSGGGGEDNGKMVQMQRQGISGAGQALRVGIGNGSTHCILTPAFGSGGSKWVS